MLSRTLTFSPTEGESFFQEIPATAAVFLLRGEGEPYISKTANLRRRLQRLLGPPLEQSRRLNLRERVREVEFTCSGSDFESQLLLYRVLRETFPKTYARRLRLRPAPLVKLHLENEYPRASVTTRLSLHGSNVYYGPFPSRTSAEKFASDALDFFKMRRCVDDLQPDPSFPGCVYSEMKMCLAPCYKGCTDEEYRAEVGRVQNFFETRGDSLMRELAEHRDRASADLAFEDAAGVHAKIEKLKPLISQLPEIVRGLDQLAAIIVQPSAEANAVALFLFAHSTLHGPFAFPIEQTSEPQSLESRLQAAITAFPQSAARSALERTEQLAILKRWYYRSSRIGEVFFADEKGQWPLRRIARSIGRVHKGEKAQEFSATQRDALPSEAT